MEDEGNQDRPLERKSPLRMFDSLDDLFDLGGRNGPGREGIGKARSQGGGPKSGQQPADLGLFFLLFDAEHLNL